MKQILALTLLFASLSVSSTPPEYKIASASARGTYYPMAQQLCQYVAPDAGFDCEALVTAGSTENIYLLRSEPGVKFAILQSDLYQAFIDRANLGSRDAAYVIRPLRVLLPLYAEEVYAIARADDQRYNYLHDIKDARIAAGQVGSGTALTSTTLYRLMFRSEIPHAQYMTNEDALLKLTIDKTVDVVFVVGGQPMKLLADMKPEAKALIKLLAFDLTQPSSKEALKTYFAVTVRASSYSNLLTEDLPSLAVKAYLVTYEYELRQTKGYLAAFARSLCKHLPELQSKGHPKWKEVAISLPELGAGWSYYGPTARELSACRTQREQPKSTPRVGCPQIDYVLGLCAKESK